MDIYASDQEKSEAIKQWWRSNVRAVLAGIIMGLLILFGVRGWMEYRQGHTQEASSLYQQILIARTEKADAKIYKIADRLVQDYGNTPYGAFAALMLAEENERQGKLNRAIERLEWSLKHTRNSGLQGLIHLRLARLLLAKGNPEGALAALAKIEPGSFSSAYAELRGDAHLDLGQPAKARLAYQDALLDAGLSRQHRQILQMKLDAIAQS